MVIFTSINRMSNLNNAKTEDEFRKILKYISDRDRRLAIERELQSYIAKSFKHLEELILTYITSTNEMHRCIDLVGRDFCPLRLLLHRTDVQCKQISQHFRSMLRFVHTTIAQGRSMKISLLNNYENRLLDLKQSIIHWKHKIHSRNRKSTNLLRKIQALINVLLKVLILNGK